MWHVSLTPPRLQISSAFTSLFLAVFSWIPERDTPIIFEQGGSLYRFAPTRPANKFLATVVKATRCNSTRPDCQNGFFTTNATVACVWHWNGCKYELQCVKN